MTDRAPCSRVELDGRRVVVDLSGADADRLGTMAARSGVAGPELVLGWIRRGLLDGPAQDMRAWDGPVDRGARQARDVEVARTAEEAFRGLFGSPDRPD
ncbi:hypothetical protein [Promicromonospora sukumoe]|uniref:hypothetical protein n=1 Tax=Promicromonospora sukumoe TaxID=88382 RepID=UPI00035D06D6|nr:hypothetical protein [Promicromonospora sukumoe]